MSVPRARRSARVRASPRWRPQIAMIAYIDAHRDRFGVEPQDETQTKQPA